MKQGCLAISTAWNSGIRPDIKQILSEIKQLGFNAIEIGYNFTPRRLKELISLLDGMGISVVSVHNFCPLPSEVKLDRFPTNYYCLSSLDEQERSKAVEYTKKSIDTACQVSCSVVVIHAGSVPLGNDCLKTLLKLYHNGKFGSEEYQRVKQELLTLRQAKKPAYFEAVVKSLRSVIEYACSCGIKVGLETRYYPNEIPDIEEVEYLLKLFQAQGLVYWHDIGHAEVNERLGIAAHDDYLRRFSGRMAGVHLHDLKGIDDHRAPFTGDLDFSKMVPYLRDGLIKVIEAHPPATPQQIKAAMERLSSLPI